MNEYDWQEVNLLAGRQEFLLAAVSVASSHGPAKAAIMAQYTQPKIIVQERVEGS